MNSSSNCNGGEGYQTRMRMESSGRYQTRMRMESSGRYKTRMRMESSGRYQTRMRMESSGRFSTDNNVINDNKSTVTTITDSMRKIWGDITGGTEASSSIIEEEKTQPQEPPTFYPNKTLTTWMSEESSGRQIGTTTDFFLTHCI